MLSWLPMASAHSLSPHYAPAYRNAAKVSPYREGLYLSTETFGMTVKGVTPSSHITGQRNTCLFPTLRGAPVVLFRLRALQQTSPPTMTLQDSRCSPPVHCIGDSREVRNGDGARKRAQEKVWHHGYPNLSWAQPISASQCGLEPAI